MIHKDYLMKFMLAFSKALAEVLARKKSGRYEEAVQAADEAFAVDEETRQLFALPLGSFITEMDHIDEFDVDKYKFAAELLYEKGDLLHLMGSYADARDAQVRSLHLMLLVLLKDPKTFRQKEMDRVAELSALFDRENLPASTQNLLDQYSG